MDFLTAHPILVLVVLVVGLSLPVVLGASTAWSLAKALAALVFGVVLPLFVFLASSLLVAEFDWKGACTHGWVDGFHLGKLALAPLVLWATCSFFEVDMFQWKPPFRRSTILGLIVGATVAGGCFLFGAVLLIGKDNGVLLWLLVPLYVAIWYAIRAWQLMRVSKPLGNSLWLALLGTVPFWIGSLFWSRRFYESLPDTAPQSCFVVTAGSRGHRRIVGPVLHITRRNEARPANQQLLTFWQFEDLWHSRAPESHAAFRRLYNRLGPIIGRRITSRWLADVTFLALKPAEWLAAIVVHFAAVTSTRDNPDHRRKTEAHTI